MVFCFIIFHNLKIGIKSKNVLGSSLQKYQDFEKCCFNLDCGSIHINIATSTRILCARRKSIYTYTVPALNSIATCQEKQSKIWREKSAETFQNTNICGDFKKNVCKQSTYNRRSTSNKMANRWSVQYVENRLS